MADSFLGGASPSDGGGPRRRRGAAVLTGAAILDSSCAAVYLGGAGWAATARPAAASRAFVAQQLWRDCALLRDDTGRGASWTRRLWQHCSTTNLFPSLVKIFLTEVLSARSNQEAEFRTSSVTRESCSRRRPQSHRRTDSTVQSGGRVPHVISYQGKLLPEASTAPQRYRLHGPIRRPSSARHQLPGKAAPAGVHRATDVQTPRSNQEAEYLTSSVTRHICNLEEFVCFDSDMGEYLRVAELGWLEAMYRNTWKEFLEQPGCGKCTLQTELWGHGELHCAVERIQY
ncbi:uncharacterized protein LOC143435242 [Arvicanthis niloticus]|uniref:uncharacterized protein LOC143435242 n=1 Tax=Arvicanthis niloticus TaxID=61156 RepID=UPI00403CF9EA